MLTIWRHLAVEVPDDWEMLLFTKEPAAGRCAFADRYQHRLELSWQAVPGKPDFDRMLSDYEGQLKGEQGAEEVHRVRSGDWQGLAARVGGVFTSRFGRHFEGEGLLAEIVFLWPAERDEKLERGVLLSVREEPARDGRRRWRAFGMEMLVSEGLALMTCDVAPGSARMAFKEGENSLREERFERLGLVSEWLHESPVEWLRRRAPAEVTVRSQSVERRAGHDAAVLAGDRHALGMARLRGRRVAYRAEAWICPADGRLYCATFIGGDEGPAGRLRCCGG